MYKFGNQKVIEEKAENINKVYDAKRLIMPTIIDIYDLADAIGARLVFDYISPDQTFLGATVFQTGYIWVWPGNPYTKGMKPKKQFFYENTIIIDRGLEESKVEIDCNIENFTVAHEAFHFFYHKDFFGDGCHMSRPITHYREEIVNNDVLGRIEVEANYGAAAFLMPREVVYKTARRMLGYKNKRLAFGYPIKDDIKEMGRLFGVNYSPMVYRLQKLDILDSYFDASL